MHPNAVDWIAIAAIVLSGLAGMRRGLVVSALSLGGLVAGAYAGSRVAPHVLNGGARSPWTPLAGLVGAIFGAVLLQTLAVFAGSFARGTLRFTPLRLFDSAGGLAFGVGMGLVIVWVVGAAALLVPGQASIHRDVRASSIIRRLDEAVPPQHFLHLLARIDPYPSVKGPPLPVAKPTAHIATNARVRRASRSVVRVLGSSCGFGVEGTGWFAAPHLVVTAAHVVAGESGTIIQLPGAPNVYHVEVVGFDVRDDIAVLRTQRASAPPLRLAQPVLGASTAIVGYPGNGPLHAAPGRIGRTEVVLTQDAYGHGPVSREITTLAGVVQHGDSGAPAIDASGVVEATVFATRVGPGRPGGYGVPASVVRRVLDAVRATPVSTGACASG
ncbi:MAG TPA: MarP family serine protease [Gaiellaceae bacterium]